jgi:thiol-disulfide isomerase/thioredoxin
MHATGAVIAAVALAAVALAIGASGAAQDDGHDAVKVAEPAVRPAAIDRIFDEAADPLQDIAAALAAAKKENHRVLVVWGADWCSWCRAFDALSTSEPKIKRELLAEYEVVHVDIGRFDRNLELAATFGLDIARGDSIPHLSVLDADGTHLASRSAAAFELRKRRRRGHDPAKVLDFLVKNQAPYPPAESVLSAALAAAKKQGKRVLLYFTAPGSATGRDLQSWIESEFAAPILARELLVAKIDVQRTIGGKDLAWCLREDGEKSLPWFAVLDADGHPIATSEGADGKNIQFPSDAGEIAHFQGMLRKSATRLSEADVEALGSSLTDLCEKAAQDKVPEKTPSEEPAGG